jgi:lysophospholipase L1-like esterase
VLNRALDYPDVFLKDHDLFWRFRPDQNITSQFFEGKTYAINSHGCRGPEIDEEKRAQRVVLIGNSCLFGWGVSYDKSVAGQLQASLGADYEVINGAIPGYSSWQGRGFYESELTALEPDLVVIMFGWNDQWAAASGIADNRQQFPPRAIIALQNCLAELHSYRLLKKLLLTSTEPSPDSLFDRAAPVYRVGLEDFRDNLTYLCDRIREDGAQPILMTEPQPSNAVYGEAVASHPAVRNHQRYNQVVRELALDFSVTLIDAARLFDQHDDLYDDARRDFIHFNDRGHVLIAQALTDLILSPDTTAAATER